MQDALKPGIKTVFNELHRQGIQTILLSGDTAKRCTEVAKELGIKKVFSEQLPADKARVIQQLKSEGRVIMIGDGINDAPSLTLADVGISFGDASKIAVNSAEVIFLNGGIDSLLKIIRTGKLTFQTIRQNLFWAFAYNIIAIPVAAAGFLSPMVAALSMAFSDVIVIGNSIRLKFRK
jgi:Cu+-exporting ATPase